MADSCVAVADSVTHSIQPLQMLLKSEQQAGDSKVECKLLDLARELRDAIWTVVVDEDLNGTTEGKPLATCSLLAVSRQVRDEVSSAFLAKEPFFKNSLDIARFLRWEHIYHGRELPKGYQARILMAMTIGKLSVIPDGRQFTAQWANGSRGWHREIGRRSTIYCSSAHKDAWCGAESGMAGLLSTIRMKNIGLRSLEIPVALLFNISIVRALRRLRGLNLHLAFVSESTKLEDLTLDDSKRLPPSRAWLSETGDIELDLPIYGSPVEIIPIALAPLTRFAAAIRMEVASTERAPISISQLQVDPPLWVEFENDQITTTNGLSQPASGWYRYVSHDPGVCCLENISAPTPPWPRERKQLKRCRRELGKLLAARTRRCPEDLWQVDRSRAEEIKRLGLQSVVVKTERKLQRKGSDYMERTLALR